MIDHEVRLARLLTERRNVPPRKHGEIDREISRMCAAILAPKLGTGKLEARVVLYPRV